MTDYLLTKVQNSTNATIDHVVTTAKYVQEFEQQLMFA